jgi:PmbA protein
MKNNDKLLQLADKLAKYGKQKGANEAQISISDGEEFSCECREGNIEKLLQSGSKSASIKVIVDKKVATASSSDLSEDTLKSLIDKAVERAKFSSADEFAGLPEFGATKVDMEKLKLYDESVLKMKAEDKIKFAKELEKIGMADKRIRNSGGSSFSSGVSSHILANSNGFAGAYSETFCSTGLSLQAGEGDNFQEDYWYESAHGLSQIPSAEAIAKKAIHRVTRLIGARKIETQSAELVLEPEMAASLFGFFIQCISGSAVYMKQTFLADKLNQQIAASMLNIYDDPTIPGASGSRPWDGEGVTMNKMPIIEKGVLKNFLLDTYSAKKLNMKSNGHASGVSNFYVEAGKHKPEEIIKSVKKGLYLTRTIGQGTVPTSGDISKGAFGIWIENGELTYPVSEITFTGKLGEMLSNIVMIGDDLNLNRGVCSPTLKIKEISLSGKS